MRPGQGVQRQVAAADFRGHGTSALDGKGRFALPIAFRSVLIGQCSAAGTMQVRADPDRPYISIFGDLMIPEFKADFAETARYALQRGDAFDREQQDADFFGSITEVSCDSGGRFCLPPVHKRIYGLTDGVFLVGGGRLIQLWDPERFLASNPRQPIHVEACETFLATLKAKREGGA